MAVKTKEEILAEIKEAAGDQIESDAYITIIEDISDSMDESLGAKVAEAEKRAADVEAEWRKKYTDRFFSGTNTVAEGEAESENGDNVPAEETDDIEIDDLFEEIKKEV